MPQPGPSATPRGLATVALLKARLDEGRDHLGLFEPLVADALVGVAAADFAAADIKVLIAERTGLVMPVDTVQTLLGRFTKKGYLTREGGRFFRTDKKLADPGIESATGEVQKQQVLLGSAFLEFAAPLEVKFASPEDALLALATFVSDNKVQLVLDEPPAESPLERSSLDRKTTRAVARFITERCFKSEDLGASLRALTEGMLLQDTLLLRDIPNAAQRFQHLVVAVDTSIVLALLGLTGFASEVSMKEGISLLRESGAEVVAFERTIGEVRRILSVYEERLVTTAGRLGLFPTPLTQHVLKARITSADMRIISATVPKALEQIGISVRALPEHVPAYTLDEKNLATRLADPKKPDPDGPRVRNDVDCLAAVLTLRRGRTSTAIERSVAIFSSTSGRVVKTIQSWFFDQGEKGIPPIVHHSALTSIAWLKKPASAPDLKMHELAALCVAAMRPTRATWVKFVDALRAMRQAGTITDDETAAIVVSELTEPILARLDDEFEPDADSVGEAIQRVRESYQRDAASAAAEAVSRAAADTALAQAVAEEAMARHDALQKAVDADLERRSGRLSNLVFGVGVLVLAAAVLLSLPGVFDAVGPPMQWIGRGVLALAGLFGLFTAIRGGSLSELRSDLKLKMVSWMRPKLPSSVPSKVLPSPEVKLLPEAVPTNQRSGQ